MEAPQGSVAGRLPRVVEFVAARSVAIAAILLPLAIVLLLVVQARTDWRQLLHEVQVSSATLAHVLAEHADRLLENADLVRVQTVNTIDPDALHTVGFAEHIQIRRFAAASPHVVSIWVGDRDGRAVVTSREFPTPALDASDRPYFTTVRDRPDHLYVGALDDNRYADEVLIATSRRLTDSEGGFAGFVQVALSPHTMRTLLRRAQLPFQASFWWLGPDGQPLMRDPPLDVDSLDAYSPDIGALVRVNPSGSVMGISAHTGERRLLVFSQAPEFGSTIVIGIAADELGAVWWTRIMPTLLLGATLIAALLVILLLIRREQERTRSEARLLEREVAARTRDLRAAVEERQILLDELRHRVGNAYATIQALAQQMLRAADNLDSFRESFPGRLSALAATQGLLIANDERRAPLETIIWSELAPYRDRDDPRLVVEGPPVTLPGQRATAAGLVLHELTTNAVKYGALSVPEGRIEIRWRIDGEGRLRLTWTERGGPPVEPPREDGGGFGSRMLDRTARLNGGSIRVEYKPQGVEAELILPLGL